MGYVRFDGEDELQPSTSDGNKYKSSEKLLHDCGAVNNASVPRKIRSAIRKRARESVILPLPISRKQRRVSNGVEKPSVKKSRLIMKQGQITKDEEEVAETLNALADMFSDIAKTNKPVLDDEPSKIKSSSIVEPSGSSITAADKDSVILNVPEESKKMNTRVTLEATNHSSAIVETRPKISGADMNVWDQVSPNSENQYGNCKYTKDDKFKELLSSEIQGSILGSFRFPTSSENTSCATQSIVTENSFIADKIHYPQAVLEPKKQWKRCSAHVCIASLIKVLQKSKTSKRLTPRTTQLTTSGGMEQRLHTSTGNQKGRINGSNDDLSFNGCTYSASEKDLPDLAIANLSYKSLCQDSKTSAIFPSLKQGSDLLSLAVGGCRRDTNEGINTDGSSLEALKQFHASYQNLQSHKAMHSSLLHNGYSSTFQGLTSAEAALQVKLSPYLSNTGGSVVESQQQKWPTHGGVAAIPHVQEWRRDSASPINYALPLFPHLHSKYQLSVSPPQQQYIPSVNASLALSNTERHHQRLNPAFGNISHPDNIHLLCNHHL